jgi:hypothetical protein
MAGTQQSLADMRSDKARAACNEEIHRHRLSKGA